MTIEEAVRHCYDVAENNCAECGKEHLQLAEWLHELCQLRLENSALRLAIAAAPEKNWIPCSERTPENAGEDVIVYAKNRYGQDAEFIAFQGYGDFKWHTMDTRFMDHTQPGQEVSKAWEITHWMPLPEPPVLERLEDNNENS